MFVESKGKGLSRRINVTSVYRLKDLDFFPWITLTCCVLFSNLSVFAVISIHYPVVESVRTAFMEAYIKINK